MKLPNWLVPERFQLAECLEDRRALETENAVLRQRIVGLESNGSLPDAFSHLQRGVEVQLETMRSLMESILVARPLKDDSSELERENSALTERIRVLESSRTATQSVLDAIGGLRVSIESKPESNSTILDALNRVCVRIESQIDSLRAQFELATIQRPQKSPDFAAAVERDNAALRDRIKVLESSLDASKNWIATTHGRQIAGMARTITFPQQP